MVPCFLQWYQNLIPGCVKTVALRLCKHDMHGPHGMHALFMPALDADAIVMKVNRMDPGQANQKQAEASCAPSK
jgi:hypothetical protein